MRRSISLTVLALCLCVLCVSGAAAETPLQNIADRGITPEEPPVRREASPGVSPVTGRPWSGEYLPMLVQISNIAAKTVHEGATVRAAGVDAAAPWGAQYADVIFEGILYATGATRLSFLFSDSFSQGQPVSVGPVRSARVGHVLLREEWQSGFVYGGGPDIPGNSILQLFSEFGADEKGVLFSVLDARWKEYYRRIKAAPPPDNCDVNLAALRERIPDEYAAAPRAFLFSDDASRFDAYGEAAVISLDWGDIRYESSFVYSPRERLYRRYVCGVPYVTFISADERGETAEIPFNNLILQRVDYEYADGSKIMPIMRAVGRGNADIFIGGRYIPGYWVRQNESSPTIYYDDAGMEIRLDRGRTFIAHFPKDGACAYR